MHTRCPCCHTDCAHGVTEHCWVQEGFCCCAPQLTPYLTLKSEWSGISHTYMQPNLDASRKLMRGSALPLSVSKQISKKRRAGDTATEEHTTLQGERPFKDKSGARTGTDNRQRGSRSTLQQKLIPTVCDLCSPLPSPATFCLLRAAQPGQVLVLLVESAAQPVIFGAAAVFSPTYARR